MTHGREVVDYSSDVTLLSPEELCERWARRVTTKTLANWRSQGKGPSYVRYTGRIMYPLDFVMEYENGLNFITKRQHGREILP